MPRILRRMLRKPLGALGLLIVLGLVVVAILAPQIAPQSPIRADFMAMLQPPSAAYPLGTDELGRDMLSRLIWGARASLQAGLIAVLLAAGIGVPIGLVSGYFRGPLDEYVVMRLTDAMMAFPVIVLALALTAVLGPSLQTAMVAIGIVYAPIFIRLARAQTLSVREADYVEAARALGNRHLGIMVKHVLPNIASPLIIQMSVSMATAILVESALSFLGLGVQPPSPSWGSMLRIGANYMQEAPWIAFWPGLAIFVAVLGINLFGDALRDVLDPRDR
jgi:peptide/nickel transport system permease protein